jgi:demethylmenaquinone methyltransferase/2-methoxy-6-polyprenyl-1,4-benzoquinol methylase
MFPNRKTSLQFLIMAKDAFLIEYYAKRAQEYERLYEKPERQADLAAIKKLCAEAMAGKHVLEIACGTGYWTQAAAQTARSIVATDINEEVLQIARSKSYPCGVQVQSADAFILGSLPGQPFTAGMAMHWWSHLRQTEIPRFLAGFHQLFSPGARLLFMDNRFVAGSNTPISRTDAAGNTYQLRRLADGTGHEVLKNFPSASEVQHFLGEAADEVCWTELPYYWILTYQLRK